MQSATLALLAGMTFLVVLVLAIIDLMATLKGLPKDDLEGAEAIALRAMSHDRPRTPPRSELDRVAGAWSAEPPALTKVTRRVLAENTLERDESVNEAKQ